MSDLKVDTIIAGLKAEGIDAQWFHTGGGCGTLYVGEKNVAFTSEVAKEWGEDFGYEAVAGPGSYHAGLLYSGELALGPDSPFGDDEVTYASPDATAESVAKFLVNYVRGGRVARG